jgi:hypothetical protein
MAPWQPSPLNIFFAKNPSLKHFFSTVVLISKSRDGTELTPELVSRWSWACARAGLAPPPAGRRLEQRRQALQERRPEQRRRCLQERRQALQERRKGRAPLPVVPHLEQLPHHPLPLRRCPELPSAAPLLRSPSKGSDHRGEVVLPIQ